MGIPRKQVGYYVGLIDSFYYGTGAITILQWSRLSDYIGRKPVLLIGLASLSTSILLFGLAESFWGLVIRYAVRSALTISDPINKEAPPSTADVYLVSSMANWVSSRAL
jgi:MFS family permease